MNENKWNIFYAKRQLKYHGFTYFGTTIKKIEKTMGFANFLKTVEISKDTNYIPKKILPLSQNVARFFDTTMVSKKVVQFETKGVNH